MAKYASSKSKDPNKKVGAVIVDRDNRVVSVAFNGFPQKLHDTKERLLNKQVKLSKTIHAEQNAIFFANKPVKGCTLYVWPIPPCELCSLSIIQSGITKVVSPKIDISSKWYDSCTRAELNFKEAGVCVEHINDVSSKLKKATERVLDIMTGIEDIE
jgi:dCMP deaminase